MCAQAEKEAKDKAAGKEVDKADDPAAAMSTPTANVLVMHGNILYDWSQVGAVGRLGCVWVWVAVACSWRIGFLLLGIGCG